MSIPYYFKNDYKNENYEKMLPIENFLPEFQIKLKEFICDLCRGIYKDPIKTKEGQIFCKKCFIKAIGDEKIAKEKIKSEIKNILKDFKLNCINHKFGCDWIGDLEDLDSHLNNSCHFQMIKCKNLNCDQNLFKNEIESHDQICKFKPILCPHCYAEITIGVLESHYQICPRFKIICLNCEILVERCEMLLHMKESCQKFKFDCPYKQFGCNEGSSPDKNEMKIHMEKFVNEHLDMLMISYSKLEKEYNDVYKFLVNLVVGKVSHIEDYLVCKDKDFQPFEEEITFDNSNEINIENRNEINLNVIKKGNSNLAKRTKSTKLTNKSKNKNKLNKNEISKDSSNFIKTEHFKELKNFYIDPNEINEDTISNHSDIDDNVEIYHSINFNNNYKNNKNIQNENICISDIEDDAIINQNTKSKRKRGRPKKSDLINIPSEDKQNKNEEEFSHSNNSKNDELIILDSPKKYVKIKKGRVVKNIDNSSHNSSNNNDSELKINKSSKNELIEVNESSNNNREVKRRRGRPKKNKKNKNINNKFIQNNTLDNLDKYKNEDEFIFIADDFELDLDLEEDYEIKEKIDYPIDNNINNKEKENVDESFENKEKTQFRRNEMEVINIIDKENENENDLDYNNSANNIENLTKENIQIIKEITSPIFSSQKVYKNNDKILNTKRDREEKEKFDDSNENNNYKKQNKETIPYNFTPIILNDSQSKITFDELNSSKGLLIKEQKVSCITPIKNEHLFIFHNYKLDPNSSSKWRILLKDYTYGWIALGACYKEVVLFNKLKFVSPIKNFNHGCFLISSNNFAWNANDTMQNNMNLNDLPKFHKEMEIFITFDHNKNTLKFEIKNFNLILENVITKPNEGLNIVPCALMLNYGDCLEFEILE